MLPTDARRVVTYHDATKHHFSRYARGPGGLDWASQPYPFRYYQEAPRIIFEHFPENPDLLYDELYLHRPGRIERVEARTIAEFCRYSLGLSAWKQFGASRWALRVNPSSGNLHPTEGYLVLRSVPGWREAPGVYHYVPDRHLLEVRSVLPAGLWERLTAGLPEGSFLVGLSSVHWREAWKYGERAFRYCQLDAGHAICALRFAAALFGWDLSLVVNWPTEAVAALLGLDRREEFPPEEREEPELLAVVSPGARTGAEVSLSDGLLQEIRASRWFGEANRLSSRHVRWDAIDVVADATRVPSGSGLGTALRPAADQDHSPISPAQVRARRIMLQRRSGLAFDGESSLSLERFRRVLLRLLPGKHPPWDALPWPPAIHLVLFVHRVAGLPQGLYALVRRAEILDRIGASTRTEFLWERPGGVPADLPFFLLLPGDWREAAALLSCRQDIAGDGYFSLAMIAEFSTSLDRYGPWFYRNLFWEAGFIGQILYLEAEAAGGRGTGIGCYFDDPVHELLGLQGHEFQDLYHFTVGTPIEDSRLTTLPPNPEKGREQ
ncbi:MAG TPA: SagB/ThcOx family dehydrogenase [Syntrophobacteria bacterium]|nr:SagB/ThcOx family dehydrogenase [Syntrophobacteria bacterium]